MTWYVYSHTLDGELIYIGAGQKRRPFNRIDRNSLWKAMVRAGNDLRIEVLAILPTKDAALDLEYSLIARLQPACCLTPGGWEPTAKRDLAIRQMRASGMTLQVIGDEYGLTRERVRQICDPSAPRKHRLYRRHRYRLQKQQLSISEAAA